jgi:hypothetical protein
MRVGGWLGGLITTYIKYTSFHRGRHLVGQDLTCVFQRPPWPETRTWDLQVRSQGHLVLQCFLVLNTNELVLFLKQERTISATLIFFERKTFGWNEQTLESFQLILTLQTNTPCCVLLEDPCQDQSTVPLRWLWPYIFSPPVKWKTILFFVLVFHFTAANGLALAKAAALRINLNLDGAPIASKSHTHPSHSQTSRLLTSSLSLGVPVPRPTQCVRGA